MNSTQCSSEQAMSTLKRFVLRKHAKFTSLSSPYIQITAYLSSSAQEKILKNSDHILNVIDQRDTRTFDKWSYRKSMNAEKFALKRKMRQEECLKQPHLFHPLIFSLMTAESGSEILKIINNVDVTKYSTEEKINWDPDPLVADTFDANEEPTIHRIFSKAIRCCADMGEINICQQIFKQCKKNGIVSNQLYSTMMWLCMYNNRDAKSLKKVFRLKNELDSFNLEVHPRTYTTLINCCVKAGDYHQGLKVLHDIEKNHAELLKHSRLVETVMRLSVYCGEIDKAVNFLDTMSKTDAMVWCRFDHYRYREILSRMALDSSTKVNDWTETAERIFRNCLVNAIKYNVEVPTPLFNGMIEVYAANDDFDSCFELLGHMIDPDKKHILYPSPTAVTFQWCLKSLIYCDKDKWKKLDSVLEIMDKINVHPFKFGFYLVLFEICDDDIERAKKFYDDMSNIYGINPNMALLESMFEVGVKHFEKHKDNEKFEQFLKWILDEYDKYNIIPTKGIKLKWKAAAGDLSSATGKPLLLI